MPTRDKLEELARKIAEELGESLNKDILKEALLEALSELGYNEPKDIPQPNTKPQRVVITGFGSDRPGILSALTTLLAEENINIIDITQKILEGIFTVIIFADLSQARCDFPDLKKKLFELSSRIGVRFEAQSYALFEAMHRI